MKGKVLYRNGKEIDFDVIDRIEIRSGLMIVMGYVEIEENSYDYREVIEPLAKISLIKGEQE